MHIQDGIGMVDGLVCRFRPDGSLFWVECIGGPGAQVLVSDICTDGSGGLYLTGYFSGTVDFDPGPGHDIKAARGYISTFVSRWDIEGNYLWTVVLGGPIYAKGGRICVTDPTGVYAGGIYNCPTDFDPGPGADPTPFHGDWDIFVTRLDDAGRYIWTRNLSGAGYDLLCDLAAGPAGQLLVAGAFSLLVDLDPTDGEDYRYCEHQCVGAGFASSWLADGRYDWTWAVPDGQTQSAAVAVAADKMGRRYVLCEQVRAPAGISTRSSLVLSVLDPDGREVCSYSWQDLTDGVIISEDQLFWPQYWGMDIGPDRQVLIAGRFSGAVDLDPGPGSRIVTSSGQSDGFVLCLTCPPIE
jgi:hypothetical protein